MFFASVIRWFIFYYIEWHICQQFCAFKKAGSALRYTHVHLLRENDGKATGLGHDDDVPNQQEGHVAITDQNGTRTQAENAESMGLRDFQTSLTAYFHQGTADGECEEGFTSVKCKCSGEEVWVCYTLDHQVFMGWYESTKLTYRTGRYAYPYTTVGWDVTTFPPQTVQCGTSIVLHESEFKRVLNCDGWGRAGDGENQLVQNIRARLRQALDRVSCNANCIKSHVESFRGWKCGQTPDGLFAEAVVQWTVTCRRP